ncbi:hypothetical protein YDYSY3_51730 [Paenibacillus chitinolyticus]|nr:hypothetical protein YDYSY3_51730 [Paenibacillus chitinolyticus]
MEKSRSGPFRLATNKGAARKSGKLADGMIPVQIGYNEMRLSRHDISAIKWRKKTAGYRL